MRRWNLELAVGLFMLGGILCLGYLSIRLAKMEVLGGDGYEIEALFTNSGGLKPGSAVVIAGVEVGKVKGITLDDYQALVVLDLHRGIKIQEDAIAAIKTKGLIGEKFVEISPGGADKDIPTGGRLRETLPAVDFEQLLSKYVFGKI